LGGAKKSTAIALRAIAVTEQRVDIIVIENSMNVLDGERFECQFCYLFVLGAIGSEQRFDIKFGVAGDVYQSC
jgi:hypothetical protein